MKVSSKEHGDRTIKFKKAMIGTGASALIPPIEGMRPKDGVPGTSTDERSYEIQYGGHWLCPHQNAGTDICYVCLYIPMRADLLFLGSCFAFLLFLSFPFFLFKRR